MTGNEILTRVVQNPGLIRGECRKIGLRTNRPIYDWRCQTAGVDVFEEDWDALILLDGCRADAFSDCHDLPGTLESRISRGSSSMEFLETNTAGKQLHDVVYVTANPHVYRLEAARFHAVVDTLDRWDPTLQTVPPGIVTKAALEAAAQYPHKRMLIHYMQPHYPFLGPTGQKLDHRGHRPHADADLLQEPNIWAILQW